MNTETIRWIMANSVKPDDSETVLIALAEPDGDPTWVAWYCSESDEWRCAASSFTIDGVAAWAPMPRGPV
jgi:hypothetical protein